MRVFAGIAAALALSSSAIPGQVRDTTGGVATGTPVSRPNEVDTTTQTPPPLALAPLPHARGSEGSRWYWNSRDLHSSGALTVADLLDRVPGIATFRVGWLSLPMAAAPAGDVRRVRVRIDGVSIDALDPRAGGVMDLSQIPLWMAEDVLIERRAADIVVHIRTWRVNETTPYTRADMATGDVQTNLYGLLFGDRWTGGQALQLAARQYGSTPPTFLGASSDQTELLGRVGWAGAVLKADLFATRIQRHRGVTLADLGPDSIPTVESMRTDAYARVAWGDPDSSRVWWQTIASTALHRFTGARAQGQPDSVSADSSRSQVQFVATGGMRFADGAVIGAARIRQGGGRTLVTPELWGSYGTGIVSGAGWFEGYGPDSLARMGVAVEVTPLERIRVNAAVERVSDRLADEPRAGLTQRAEVGGLWRSIWTSAGVIRRDEAELIAPAEMNFGGGTVTDAQAIGVTANVEGRIWRAVHANVSAIRWNDTGSVYRPRYQTRSELSVRTTLPRRFPHGNFGLVASGVHEYRSSVLFPAAGESFARAGGYRTVSSLLEIRINTAVVWWQFRNIRGEIFHQVPGYRAPRITNYYGVRWEFWN